MILFGFPSFIFSVTAKWANVVGTDLGLGNPGFLYLFNGCHMFLAWSRVAGTWRYGQGGYSHPSHRAGCKLAELVW